MNRHITSEVLSAYLDYEVDLPVRRTVERHLESCQECRAHLVSMQRVVRGLSRVERVAPPLALAAQIRRQAEAQPAPTLWGRCKELFLDVPRRSEMRTHFAMAMGLMVSVFLVGHGIERQQLENLALQQEPNYEVSVTEGVSEGAWNSGTSEVAGRKFEWVAANKTWVQKGIEDERAAAHIDALSPEGQAMVRPAPDLFDAMLKSGRVVMLDANSTPIELSLSHS